MRLLFNATSTTKGGGAQRSASFMRHALQSPRGHEWCFAYSPAQQDVIPATLPPSVRAVRFDERPSQSQAIRRQLLQLADEFQPDCIYTQFGPAYVPFRHKHLMGVADPWVTHPSWLAYRTISFPREWIRVAAISLYKAYWFRFADAWAIETESAKQSYCRWHGKRSDRVFVVPNTCAQHYLQPATADSISKPTAGPIRILCFSAPYPHKKLDLLPAVAAEMHRREPNLEFQFIITLPPDSLAWQQIRTAAAGLQVLPLIENRGPIAIADGPQLYRECTLCFLPTVLETFSASYPEAMAMNRPMVTTNLGFAKDVCGPAALYFQPNNPRDAAEKILRVLHHPETYTQLVSAGREMLKKLPTAEQQYHQQVDLMEALAADRLTSQA